MLIYNIIFVFKIKYFLFQQDLSYGKIDPFTQHQMIRNMIHYDYDRNMISYSKNELNIFFTQIKKANQVRFWITKYYADKISMYLICHQFHNIQKVFICNCDCSIDDISVSNQKLQEFEKHCIEGNLIELSNKGNQLLLENSELRIQGIHNIISVDENYYDPLLQYLLAQGCKDCYDIEDEFLKYCGKN